jgi:signal transduction histidine kinase
MYDARLEFSKKEDALQQKNLKQQWLILAALAALALVGVILLIVIRNRKRLHYTYQELQQKNVLIESQRKKAEETLDELKATQAQLIQSEKMASLGELTAGIAHEIQNPLNFVTNFSETSIELLDEMKDELNKGNPREAREIAAEVIGNLEKINQHGKRADSIVKGMLQHSRASSGQKEATDINVLVDEYIHLSYHSLRAKDKSFNATINKDFDATMGKIMLVPQDMGRVILNLVNNAFYAVQQKQNQTGGSEYQPTVTLSTQKLGDKVVITVGDNGNGMTDNVRKKIFQPFFTTKPTGQGTGLGLSLSYDIVTKGYGGTLDVQSKEGEGAVFTITVPALT